MKYFSIILCIFSVCCVWSEELNIPMYCSGDLELIPPMDDIGVFYRESKNFDEQELVQHLREIIHFPLKYLIVEEGVIRKIPSEKFEEFLTSIYGRQFIQYFQGDSQEKHKSTYELSIGYRCGSLDNRYGISILSFVRHPESEEKKSYGSLSKCICSFCFFCTNKIFIR